MSSAVLYAGRSWSKRNLVMSAMRKHRPLEVAANFVSPKPHSTGRTLAASGAHLSYAHPHDSILDSNVVNHSTPPSLITILLSGVKVNAGAFATQVWGGRGAEA